jgi:SHS2 domain-containing protein
MKQFEILDISGDIGLRVFGKNRQEIFVNSAVGMYSLITDLSLIKERKTIEISVESLTNDGLFVSWLNELIFHFDTYGFVGKQIELAELILQSDKLSSIQTCTIKAILTGEDFDPERHERKLLVKAATYHKLRIEKIGDKWEADVIFDI